MNFQKFYVNLQKFIIGKFETSGKRFSSRKVFVSELPHTDIIEIRMSNISMSSDSVEKQRKFKHFRRECRDMSPRGDWQSFGGSNSKVEVQYNRFTKICGISVFENFPDSDFLPLISSTWFWIIIQLSFSCRCNASQTWSL